MTRTTADRWAIAAACACALMAAPSLATAQERVIVDADMGVMNDDAVALFMLLNSPHVEVLSVTIVPGNSWMEHGTAAALRQLELVGRSDIPVFLGAYGRPRPDSYLSLDREPAIGYPTSKPAAEHAVDIDRTAFWDLFRGPDDQTPMNQTEPFVARARSSRQLS